jgi:hypothetical protein
MSDDDLTAIDVIFDVPADAEALPACDLTLADLAYLPDVFWLERGMERLTGWVAAATDPQQRRERAEYANAVLEDITASAPTPHTIDNGGLPLAITRAGADNRWQATDQ